MWWIGTKEAIDAAEALAAKEVLGRPEYLNGVEVPPEDRVTARWADPIEVDGGRWVIPAYEGLEPEGVERVDKVDWPTYE